MKKGMIGKIIGEVFICTEEEVTSSGAITANETFIDEGEFVVVEVFEEEISLYFDNDPDCIWYLGKDEYENVEFRE